MRNKDVCILFSGGSDSSLTAYRMSKEFEKVHLLTFKHFGQVGIEKSRDSYALLDEKFPGRFVHSITEISDLFLRIYNKNYLRNLFRYGTLQMQFPCFSCQACFHINTIIYCLKHDIHDVRDGANTEYEEASPMQIPIVKKEIKKLYADYGITHDSPIYDEHENARSDHQLFALGLRPQENIKDDQEMYEKYQGYCKVMPGSVLFLNYWKRCGGFPEKVQEMMKQRWVEEVRFFKSVIDHCVTS